MRYTTAALAASLATYVVAHPVASPNPSPLQPRTIDVSKFRLKTAAVYNSTKETGDISIKLLKRDSYVDTTTELVKKALPGTTFRLVGDHYVGSNGVAHVNFKQTANGLDIDNADFNVNIAKDGTVFSHGNSFYTRKVPSTPPAAKRDHVDPVKALRGVTRVLGLQISASSATTTPANAPQTFNIEGTSGAHQNPQDRLVYFQNPEGTLDLAWRVETDTWDNWFLSPWPVENPNLGDRTIETDPWDITASTHTWEADASTTYTTTRGNNGIAQVNYDALDLSATDSQVNANASVTQLFYTANMYHDLLYKLGFTEAAGNFETSNDGNGGVGNDQVILKAQDGSGTNNPNFATPPDGQSGHMRMFIWTETTPVRDCAFEAGVIIHEYTHGLSNRLTGGPSNTACLNVLEAGGIGEGWGDFMATAIRTKSADTRATDYPLGEWVFGDPNGLRAYLHSTSLTTNPPTYGSANQLNEVHAIGTIWATMLYEVMWKLIDAHGNTDAIRPTFEGGVPTDGRYLAMKLIVDGMALQPCNPNFIQARDAILDADVNLTGGENACSIWTAFAKRGLGENAARNSGTSRTEDFTVPSGVC